MLTKSFDVVLEVYGCINCPYNNQIIGCEKAGPEVDIELLEEENMTELTTCPMLKNVN